MQGDRTTIPTSSEGLIDENQRTRHGRTSGPARRSTRGQWTAEEDEILRKAVQRFKGKNWKKIAECFKDRTDVQCLHRWQKVLNPELVKGPWTKEEDEMIIDLVNKYGPKKWSTIARYLPGRIGKQCRERWHNHLNPAINKEAWTPEEELILIRAHQIYGNRWAELTKFLPGRTDNGIKNHWHSSVKKKLDSYLASGLLDQYQALPLVPFQKSSMLSSSVDTQRIIDENGCLGGVAENESECSQSSSTVGCSLSAVDLPNGVINTGQHFHPGEIACENEQAALAAYHQDQYYYPALEDITVSISEVSCEMEDSSKFPDQELSQDVVTSSSLDFQLSFQCLPDIASLELRDESSGPPALSTNESNKATKAPVWTSTGLGAPASVPSMEGTTSYNSPTNMLISDVEYCGVLFPSEENNGRYNSTTLIQQWKEVDQAECQDSLPCPSSSDIQMLDSIRTPASQSCPSRSNALAAPGKETLRPAPLIISADSRVKDSTRLVCHPFEAEPKCSTNANDSFICIDDPAISPRNDYGTDKSGQKERSFQVNDSKKLVPVNDFASQPNVKPGSPPIKQEPDVNDEEDEDAGCQEPLRFPSLDVPFFSCDLIHSKNDLLQDFSPLGIRKLLMSTMTCMSPVRLWDSPTRDHSPGAVIKTAMKTSVGAPSILKKRHRDLLSPLSERRSDKKLETDITASLAKDFSRLDVMINQSGNNDSFLSSPTPIPANSVSTSLEEKENRCHALNGKREANGKGKAFLISSNEVPEATLPSSNSLEKGEQAYLKTNAEGKDDTEPAAQNEENFSGVFAERNTSKPFLFSSDQSVSRADKTQVSSTVTPRNQLQRTLMTTSNKEHSSASLCLVINSPARTRNTEGHLVDNMTSNVGNENLSMFCGTPFRRSLDSPSAWKSPLFINSFLSSPRFDSELTIEDMGYIFSPYDAIGFVKQLSEHTAASTVTNAIEVLANDTPETTSRQKQTDRDKENVPVPAERRVLDFNDCDSPAKSTQNVKPSTSSVTNSVSPSSSSYLLKGCR